MLVFQESAFFGVWNQKPPNEGVFGGSGNRKTARNLLKKPSDIFYDTMLSLRFHENCTESIETLG